MLALHWQGDKLFYICMKSDLFVIHSIKQSLKVIETGDKWSWKVLEYAANRCWNVVENNFGEFFRHPVRPLSNLKPLAAWICRVSCQFGVHVKCWSKSNDLLRKHGCEGREGSEGQRHKDEDREGRSGIGEGDQGPLAMEGGTVLGYLCRGPPPKFLIAPLLVGLVCLARAGLKSQFAIVLKQKPVFIFDVERCWDN